MKKTYMRPDLEVVELSMHTGILAGSLSRSEGDAPIDGSGDYESLSRGFDFDEDE